MTFLHCVFTKLPFYRRTAPIPVDSVILGPRQFRALTFRDSVLSLLTTNVLVTNNILSLILPIRSRETPPPIYSKKYRALSE